LTANTKVDVWSVGVVLLLLLRNELPFTDNDPTFIIDQVCSHFSLHFSTYSNLIHIMFRLSCRSSFNDTLVH
jgi:serine/threonine protein kinase